MDSAPTVGGGIETLGSAVGADACRNGHLSGRYENGRCKQCCRDAVARVSKEKQREYDLNGRRRNPQAAWRKRGVVGTIPPYPVLGPCEACGEIPLELHCDHDHATGLFRGWLCALCNQALGQAKDSVETLRKLIRYLETRQ